MVHVIIQKNLNERVTHCIHSVQLITGKDSSSEIQITLVQTYSQKLLHC
jgi:hypothetical protein